ncbi:MAG: class I SAM-dependent methyltransferase [Cyanobacteria bacterium J06642_9]
MSTLSELKRFLLFLPEMLIGGPAYARHLFLTRSSTTLNEQAVWCQLTQPEHPFIKWISDHYPPAPFRKLLLDASVVIQDRLAGVSKHYDISNDFYKLFLDQKYLFYTCADFINDTDTIEDAQENKANYILDLIDPQPGERILDLGCGSIRSKI